MPFFRSALVAVLLAQAGFSQGIIRLKTRNLVPTAGSRQAPPADSPEGVKQHYLILFASYPGQDVVAELAARRIVVLAYVPENALMVSAEKLNLRGLDVIWAGPMDPADKISPVVSSQESGSYLVIFQPDTDSGADGELAQNLGFTVMPNSNLLTGQLVIAGPYSALPSLAALDQVAYILPASAELLNGDAIIGCPGAVTPLGLLPQYVKADSGWTQDANGQVALGYYFDSLTPDVAESELRSEIARAFAAWTQAANITITPANEPALSRSIDVLFARYAHGDAYPFDGPGGVLAHTFYPAPNNPEPLAGDMHLNADESWSVGGTVDIFSVALHEAGHALGLGHSDDPTAVMYPYYRLQTGLMADDIAGIQALYGTPAAGAPPAAGTGTTGSTGTGAAGTGTGTTGSAGTASTNPGSGSGPTTAPPTISITFPAFTMVSTSAASISFSGTAGEGVTSVQWTTSTGSSGTAIGTTPWSAVIPLLVGNNTVTVRAYNSAGNSSWRAVTVIRSP
jgi:hypothetical protein